MIRALFLEELSLWSWAWQSTLFALIGLAGSFLLRRRPARACKGLFLAMVAAVLVPAMSVLVTHFGLGLLAPDPVQLEMETPYTNVTIDYQAPAAIQVNMVPADIQVDTVPIEPAPMKATSQSTSIPWRSVLLYGWMIAAFILLGRLFIAFVGGVCLLRRAKPQDCEQIQRAADSARARLGITKDLRVRSGRDVRSPMIWCWSRPPVLLVPGDLDYDVDWADVICHELAHWRRRDHLSGLIIELAVCILPWNPLLWWARKRVVRLSEQACDDWVLAGGRAGTDYAQSLLNLSPKVQMAFLPTVIGKEKPMKERIYRIVKEKCGDPRIGARWALAMTIIAATLTVGVAFAQRRPEREGREQQALSEHRAELEGRARELESRIIKVKDELGTLEESGKGEGEEAQRLRAELREMSEKMARTERELHGLEVERHEHEARQSWEGQEQQREILSRLEKLGRETELELRRLEEQRPGRSEEANALQRRMWELNEQMRQVRRELRRQLEEPDRRRPETEDRERPEIDRRIQELARHLDELEADAHKGELALRELAEQGKSETDEAHMVRRKLEEIRDRMQAVKEELGGVEREGARDREARGRFEPVPVPGELMREREELGVKARQIELELEELRGEHPERARKLEGELRAIHERIELIEREAGSSPGRRALRELEEQAHGIERRLEELGNEHPEEAEELRAQLGQIHEQMRRIEHEPGRIEHPMQPGAEAHREELMVHREHLQARMREMEHVLGELSEQGKGESEEAHNLGQELRALAEQLEVAQHELRGAGPDRPQERERDDLEREVQELRMQVNNVNEQMGELRELLTRLLEEGGPRERR